MDKSISNRLRELDVRRAILKQEIAIQRGKLDKQRAKLLSEVQFYMDIENNIKALYDEEEKAVDRLTRFKIRYSLD